MTEPIRLPASQKQASEALADAYGEAWKRINDAQLALGDDPLQARKKARLNELSAMVSRELMELDGKAREYASQKHGGIFTAASIRAAKAVDPEALAYVQPNIEAAEKLANGLERELLEATAHVDQTTKQLIRKIGRDAGLKTAIDGKTAKQAGTEMARILRQSGIHAVTYANGAKVGLESYARMAIRTSTALALNQGAIQGSEDAGCLWWEIFDGQTCGWKNHKDPERAHGKVVSREEALAYPIAHPNCRRAVGPRPDLGIDKSVRGAPKPQVKTNADIAKKAANNTPPAQTPGSVVNGVQTFKMGPIGGGGPVLTREQVAANIAQAEAERKATLAKYAQVIQEQKAKDAAERAAKAAAKKAKSEAAQQAASLPDPTPTNGEFVYPDYLFQVAKIDKRLKASQFKLNPRTQKLITDRLAAADFDPDLASEYDLLVWVQETSARVGNGDDLSAAMHALGRHNEKRVVRYLVDGGRMPDPIDLTPGTAKTDIVPSYPRTDADTFWQPTVPVDADSVSARGQEVIRQFNEVWGEDDLTPAQLAAVKAYSRGSDKAINTRLRKGAKDNAQTTALRAAMRPLPRSTRVMRGVDLDTFGYKAITDLDYQGFDDYDGQMSFLRAMVGNTFEDRGFMSTSVNPNGGFAAEVDIVIDVPEGYRGAWVEPHSNSPGEAELLLDRGTRLEIYKVEDAGVGSSASLARIYARVVHQDDTYDYDPSKAAESLERGKKTPGTGTEEPPLLRRTAKITEAPDRSLYPSQLPPPVVEAKPGGDLVEVVQVVGPVDKYSKLPFDIPKRPPNVASSPKVELTGVTESGTIEFADGTTLNPIQGMTFRNGQVTNMGGPSRVKWAKTIGQLWNQHNGGVVQT